MQELAEIPKENFVETIFREHLIPPDERPPWMWMEENVIVDNTSAMSANQLWNSRFSPWVKEITEEYANHKVTDLGIMTSAQSAKTQSVLCLACWTVSEDPGPMLWVTASRDDVRTFAQDRLMPTFEKCKPVNALMPAKGQGKSATNVAFATMPFEIVGAGSPSKLQSRPIRWLLLDEVRNYPPGALPMVLKRTRTYWNSKRVIISTPDEENDAVHRFFLQGDQRLWFIQCPCCKQWQTLKWDNMKWGDPKDEKHTEFRDEKGVWDYDKLAPTIRLECANPGCDHAWKDKPKDRKTIVNKGKWKATNPKAPKHRVSFNWNAMLPTWVKWRDLVEEYLDAMNALRKGDHLPLKNFINESLGEPWVDRLGEVHNFDALEKRKGAYKLREPWDEAERVFLSVDRQQDHFWYLCRAFAADGSSRLIDYGKLATEEDCEAKRIELDVDAANSMMDAGFEQAKVLKFCQKHGWKALKGSRQEFFNWTDPETGEKSKEIWSITEVKPGWGDKKGGYMQAFKLFLWSNNQARDLLQMWMEGIMGEWTLPENLHEGNNCGPKDYFRHLTCEDREEIVDSRGHVKHEWVQKRKDDHLRDCELQICIAAVITELCRYTPDTQLKKKPSEEDV